mgnify:CR=1 FL=1
MAMPDIHQGYGLPVGGVVATDARHGVVSPGAIGFDINCGVRSSRPRCDRDAIADRMETLVDALFAAIPTGVGFAERAGARSQVARSGPRSAAPPGPFAPDTATQRISSGSSPVAASKAPRRITSHRTRASGAGVSSARWAPGITFSRCKTVEVVYDERGGEHARRQRGPADGHDPHRLSRARSSGVHRLPRDHRQGPAPLRDQRARPPAGVRTGRLRRGARPTSARCARRPTSRSPIVRSSRTGHVRSLSGALHLAPRELGLRCRLRRRPQHRQGRGARGRRRPATPHRPSQGRDARVSGPAGAGAGRHGTLLLSADRDRARDARDVREHLPRRRADAQPHRPR